MVRLVAIIALAPLILCLGATKPRTATDFAAIIAPILDPAKLATLGDRGANPRACKLVYWLESARREGHQPAKVAGQAVENVRMNGESAALTRDTLLRNLSIAERLGCLDEPGMADLRKGQSPTIRRGPYAGQELTVDHIIPRSVCPELDNIIAKLELMPAKLNTSKAWQTLGGEPGFGLSAGSRGKPRFRPDNGANQLIRLNENDGLLRQTTCSLCTCFAQVLSKNCNRVNIARRRQRSAEKINPSTDELLRITTQPELWRPEIRCSTPAIRKRSHRVRSIEAPNVKVLHPVVPV